MSISTSTFISLFMYMSLPISASISIFIYACHDIIMACAVGKVLYNNLYVLAFLSVLLKKDRVSCMLDMYIKYIVSNL